MNTFVPAETAAEFCWKDVVRKEHLMKQNGIEELFGLGGDRKTPAEQQQHQQQQQQLRAFLPQNEFFTLRMEHRVGGAMARHRGEERILLFRSDRPGAIGKVIYSSIPASNGSPTAKIHVLDVKEPYRGRDLGGLLFAEAVTSLMDRYSDIRESDDNPDGRDDGQDTDPGSHIHCVLDAEEDVSRHNRLVGFYEQLGCHVKPRAKVQMLYNGADTYRKVTMQIHLLPVCASTESAQLAKFLPVSFWSNTGLQVGLSRDSLESLWTSSHEQVSHDRRVAWLVVEAPDGCLVFRTTQGHYMRVGDKDYGGCVMTRDVQDASKFFLYRVRDDPAGESSTSKELILLQCPTGNCFLTVDGSYRLTSSDRPAFWQVDAATLGLTCTTDTPLRRKHYLTSWKRQTVAYVRQMRQRYLKFDLVPGGLSFRDALDLVKNVPAHPFTVGQPSPSIRTVCYKTAEAARNGGQPDWVQFIALVHLLGSAVRVLEQREVAGRDTDDYDWTIASRSRIVGCPAPECASFGEFRQFNPDERNPTYSSSPQGMYNVQCGLDRTLLTWTGPEYMYHMLLRNDICIPEEGFGMLRFFSLGDWHAHGEYSHLQRIGTDDEGLLPFVTEFDALRRSVPPTVSDLADEECDALYESHYRYIVDKYILQDEPLQW